MSTSPMTRFAWADRPGHAVSDVWIAERLAQGWHPAAIAVAAGVSLRTAYRWRREVIRVDEVHVGGWVARYAIRRTQPPFRLEPWRREP